MSDKHPHRGRMAEVYEHRGPIPLGGANLAWVGYTSEPIPGATWYPALQAWVLPLGHEWKDCS